MGEHLQNSGDHPVGDALLVLLVVLAILVGAADLVTEGAVNQEDDQEDEVTVREEDVGLHGRAPEEGGGELSHVVEVTADAPPARDQEPGPWANGNL